ncbi:unnamed protein product [Symbiodinium natans]|uniref:FHA domain-containing protein n=1 Tax=Symbiodinium natans TaxID=878477 RepID=A0A812P4Y8_9DINO|nr:unnamed protein product [Symbiodinium natans]
MPYGSASGFFQRLRFGNTVPPGSTKAPGLQGYVTFLEKLRVHAGNSAPPCSYLRRTVNNLSGAMVNQQPPNGACAALRDLMDILGRASEPNSLLDFALGAYFDEAILRHLRSLVEEALEKLASNGEGGTSTNTPPLPVLLQHWREDFEVFFKWCEQVGEMYVYFVFLDVKGDRALLTHTVRKLQELLVVDIDGLATNLASTRHWAKLVWQELACQHRSETLLRMHGEALKQWLSHAKEAAVASLSEIGGRTFWDVYFSGLTKVSWHDFVDGLQEFLKNLCAQDLLPPLRRRLAKKSKYQVQRYQWDCLLEAYSHSVPDLLDALLEEAFEEGATLVYRGLPLPTPQQSAAGSTQPMLSRELDTPEPETRPTGEESWTLQSPDAAIRTIKPTQSSDFLLAPEHSATSFQSLASGRTPQDPRMRASPTEPGKRMEWQKFVEELTYSEPRWWASTEASRWECAEEDRLRTAAIAAVSSCLNCTRRALLLRVASGDLAHAQPVLELPSGHYSRSDQTSQLPAVFISSNSITSTMGVTKLGRGSKRKMMLPDLVMNEPIASRSHLAICYNADTDRYQLMDTGSKWGTFVQVPPEGDLLKCGDWLRIGNAELVVRFCGGHCNAHRWHGKRGQRMSAMARSMSSSSLLRGSPFPRTLSMSSFAEEQEPDEVAEQISNVLSGRPRKVWDTPVDKMCKSYPEGLDTRTGAPDLHPHSSSLPWAPLEIDFVSGPRMGERLLLTEQLCTIGRADTCTIQISDPMLANVSRQHCFLQKTAKGWKILDNKSTNGTWRRLSCVLEPSEPQDLQSGMCILAGVHEFRVEETEMDRCWLPSPAAKILQTLQTAAT